MTKKDKLIDRFKSHPKDFTWGEMETLMKNLGFYASNKGKTSGSRIEFIRESDGRSVILHKPHPGNIIKGYALKQARERLIELGEL